MKILYVGTERAEAQAIATAVNSLDEHVSVSSTADLDQVALWIDENDGLRVLLVEAQPDRPVWRSVLTYASGLPAALPVVVIVPEGIASYPQPLALEAHECIARNPSLLQDLPAVITRAIEHARQRRLERATRDMVHEQFREATIEVERARLRHASAVEEAERLARRETELSVQLDSATRALGVLERRLADAETALHAGEARAADEWGSLGELDAERYREAEQSHASAVTAAAVQCRELQAGLSAARRELDNAETALCEALQEQIRQERDARAALEQEIAGVRAELAEARREHQSATADIARLIEREALLTSELTGAHAALQDEQQRHDAALKAAAGELADRLAHFEHERAQAEAERGGLTAQLREAEEARDQASREHQSAVADVARLTERETDLEARLNDERATRDTLEQAVAVTTAALHDEQQRHDAALKAAAGELADRQAHFEHECAQAEAERGGLTAQLREVEEARDQAWREHQSAVADITRLTEHAAAERTERERLEHAHAAASAAIEQLTTERQEIERRFEEARSAFENDIEQLRISLKARVEDNHRLFQQAPVPMFRCTKDGVLKEANGMLTALVGRSVEELRGANFAATFEAPNDLSWLIERCLASKGKESTETSWLREDGSRLLVRLTACASGDSLECGVEDLTPIRVLHDRLSQAHRMEAVGRLATEVAVTCGSLLAGIQQNAQQMTDGSQLVEELSRAAGLLRQLASYGDEESRRPAVVELSSVVREVAPVLRRVAGDAVAVQLPAACAPLNVDAGAERVKRLLVNLAAYGRERMPSGGRLKIELDTVVVDRHFTEKYPTCASALTPS